MYTYGGFMLLYGRNQHNIVKQLSFNYKKKKYASQQHLMELLSE